MPPLQSPCTNCSCFTPSQPLTQFHWSRLESQLRESQLSSDVEIQTIAKLERDIEGYDLEISRLQSRIFSLQYKRGLVVDYVSRHKSLLAPIRRLPNDVLIEIFSFSSFSTTVGCDGSEVNLPQVNLGQVCSHWRSIINASPMLWSRLNLMLDDPTFSNATMMNVVNMLLTKSMDHSLTIDVTSVDGENIHPALQLLLNHSNRWMDATLQCNTSILRHVFSASGDFPRLRHLDIMNSTTVPLPVAHYPCLHSLCLEMHNRDPDVSLSQQDFPWNQLREVELRMLTINECADVLSWCTQLQNATLTDSDSDQIRVSSDNPIASSTVISLTLKDRDPVDMENFFRLAKFPQLHTLEMDGCDFPANTYSFITHSPLITTLSLEYIRSGVGDVLHILRLLPTVANFRWSQNWLFMRSGTVDDLFSNLRLHPYGSRTLLPRLRHLDVKFTYVDVVHFDITLPALTKILQARWMEVEHPNDRLKLVRLSFPQNCLKHDLIQPLNYLLKAGMAISIKDQCGFIL